MAVTVKAEHLGYRAVLVRDAFRLTPPIHAPGFFRIPGQALVVRTAARPFCFTIAEIAPVAHAAVLIAMTYRKRRNALAVLAHQTLRTGAIFARRATFVLANAGGARTARQAFMVARSAIAFVAHEVYTLSPAPGKARRAMLILRATGHHDNG